MLTAGRTRRLVKCGTGPVRMQTIMDSQFIYPAKGVFQKKSEERFALMKIVTYGAIGGYIFGSRPLTDGRGIGDSRLPVCFTDHDD